jgi:hypothetical protein
VLNVSTRFFSAALPHKNTSIIVRFRLWSCWWATDQRRVLHLRMPRSPNDLRFCFKKKTGSLGEAAICSVIGKFEFARMPNSDWCTQRAHQSEPRHTRWRGSGRLRLPEISIFLVVFAGKAGKYHQKRRILGGLQPSKPPCAGDRITRVTE